jgi:hypothetical protein
MTPTDKWERAFDALVAARQHLKEMNGKPGHQLAASDHAKALDAYDKASKDLE